MSCDHGKKHPKPVVLLVLAFAIALAACDNNSSNQGTPADEAPVVTINGDNPLVIEAGTSFTDPGTTVTDDHDSGLTATVTGEVDSSTPGTYILTYDAEDTSGNQAMPATRTVNVIDTTPPVISLLGDNPASTEVNTGFDDPGATVSDNVDNGLVASASGSVDTGTPGAYTLTYTATDSAGNEATPVERMVNVIDVTPPVITLLGDDPLTVKLNSTFSDPGATVTDDVESGISATVIGTVDMTTEGLYTLTYNASDSSGNAATPLTRTVHVSSTYRIVDLGLGYAGDINENGHVTGVRNGQAYIFDGTDFAYIGTYGAGQVTPSGINIYDQVSAIYRPTAGSADTSIAWYNGTEWILLGKFGHEFATAMDINDSGQMTGTVKPSGSGNRAYIYTGGSITLIPVPGKLFGESAYNDGMEINNDGLVAGTYKDTENLDKAYTSDGTSVLTLGTLGDPNPRYSRGHALNSSGNAVGISQTSSYTRRGFIYSNSSMQDLGTLDGNSQANDINNSDIVVGEYIDGAGNFHAFIHDGVIMQDLSTVLNHNDWVLETARNINDAGYIIGTGIINNEIHGYLLIPLP